jgi:hypothetical protein
MCQGLTQMGRVLYTAPPLVVEDNIAVINSHATSTARRPTPVVADGTTDPRHCMLSYYAVGHDNLF